MGRPASPSEELSRRALGRALSAARTRRGKSQTAVAEQIGISQAAVSNYELGRREPSFTVIVLLADAVGLDIAEAAEIVRAERR